MSATTLQPTRPVQITRRREASGCTPGKAQFIMIRVDQTFLISSSSSSTHPPRLQKPHRPFHDEKRAQRCENEPKHVGDGREASNGNMAVLPSHDGFGLGNAAADCRPSPEVRVIHSRDQSPRTFRWVLPYGIAKLLRARYEEALASRVYKMKTGLGNHSPSPSSSFTAIKFNIVRG